MGRIIGIAIVFQIFFCVIASAKSCFKNCECPSTECCVVQGYCAPLPSHLCREGNADVTNVGGGRNDRVNYANATFYSYKAAENRWNLTSASTYCSPLIANKPLAWRKKYGWASFCAFHDLKYKEVCGKCLKVTDIQTEAHEIVRIIDKCNNKGGLKLDTAIFQKLDTTGNGKIQGHLTVKYEFVNCKD